MEMVLMIKKSINYKEEEVEDEYLCCYSRIPSGKYADGTTSYAYHSCMMREVDYEDGHSTTYQCKIDKGVARENTPCRHKELFNKGYKIITDEYILIDKNNNGMIDSELSALEEEIEQLKIDLGIAEDNRKLDREIIDDIHNQYQKVKEENKQLKSELEIIREDVIHFTKLIKKLNEEFEEEIGEIDKLIDN